MTYLPGSWADVTRHGTVVRVDGGRLLVGDQPLDMPEDLLWVRADEGLYGVVIVGQGHDTGLGWTYVQARGWRSVGPTHGVSPLETDGTLIYCVHSAAEWRCYSLPDYGVHARGEVPYGSSQGWLDVTREDLHWADLARRVGAVMLPQAAGAWRVGQHPERTAIVAQRGAEAARLVADGVEAFEPRACALGADLVRVVSRTPQGVYLQDSAPSAWPVLVEYTGGGTDDTDDGDDQDDGDNTVAIPNYLSVVQDLAAQYPTEFAEAHRPELGERAWAFIRRLAWVLYQRDANVGLNGKRGTDELSMDALSVKAADGLHVFDVIVGAGGPNPQPGWSDVGGVSKWIQPEPVGDTGGGTGGGSGGGGQVTTTITAEQLRALVTEAVRAEMAQHEAAITVAIGQLSREIGEVKALADQQGRRQEEIVKHLDAGHVQILQAIEAKPVTKCRLTLRGNEEDAA